MSKDVMFVIGYIDSYGAIHARTSTDCIMHTEEEHLAGRCWRYNVFGQEFQAVLGCIRLSEDDFMLVEDWLINHGYKEAT